MGGNLRFSVLLQARQPTRFVEEPTIAVEVAEALARQRGEMMLDGQIHLPVDVAEALSRHHGNLLTFESLRFLSDGAGKAMQRYQGKLETPLLEVLHGTLPRIACTNMESGRIVESVKLSDGGVACPRKNG